MNMRKVRKYGPELREQAIQLALKSANLEVTAKELGIPRPTLNNWVIKFKQGHTTVRTKPNQETPTIDKLQSNVATLMDENRRLNKRVSTLEEEKTILKKAAAYFAREQK